VMYEVIGYCNGNSGSVCISVRMNAVPKTKQVRIKRIRWFHSNVFTSVWDQNCRVIEGLENSPHKITNYFNGAQCVWGTTYRTTIRCTRCSMTEKWNTWAENAVARIPNLNRYLFTNWTISTALSLVVKP